MNEQIKNQEQETRSEIELEEQKLQEPKKPEIDEEEIFRKIDEYFNQY